MYKIKEDLNKTTNLSYELMDRVTNKIKYFICDDILDSLLGENDTTEIDIGIGTLVIYVDKTNNAIKYKFVPSKELEDSINYTVVELKSPLKERASKGLSSRVGEIYKELF